MKAARISRVQARFVLPHFVQEDHPVLVVHVGELGLGLGADRHHRRALAFGVGAQAVEVRVVLEAVLVDVADEHRRLGGDQAQRLEHGVFFLAERDAAHRPRLVQRRLALDEHVHEPLRLLVVAGLGHLAVAREALLDRRQVGQAQLGLDDLDVGDRVDLAGDVDHVLVVEAAHHVDDRIGLADVGEELVAEAFALGRAGDQARDVDELDDRRQHALGLDDLGQLGQPRVGQLDDADVGLDGAERDSSRPRCRPSSAR